MGEPSIWVEVGKMAIYLLAGGFLAIGAKIQKKMGEKRSIEESTSIDLQIRDILASVRIQLDADRVFLSRFHNGDHFIDGSEILRKTRTDESVNPGVNFLSEEFQGMLISQVPEEIKLVLMDGPSFTKTKDLPDCKFRRVLEISGTYALARCAVRHGTTILGFVGAEWVRPRDEPPETINLLIHLAGQLEHKFNRKHPPKSFFRRKTR